MKTILKICAFVTAATFGLFMFSVLKSFFGCDRQEIEVEFSEQYQDDETTPAPAGGAEA